MDVGHYYGAPGATAASGKAELEFNQELAYELRAALEERGLRVRMIEDEAVLQELLPDADLYSGFSLFVSRLNPQLEKSVACASAIGAQMRAIGLAPSRYHAERELREPRMRRRIAEAIAQGVRQCLP